MGDEDEQAEQAPPPQASREPGDEAPLRLGDTLDGALRDGKIGSRTYIQAKTLRLVEKDNVADKDHSREALHVVRNVAYAAMGLAALLVALALGVGVYLKMRGAELGTNPAGQYEHRAAPNE